tara:strand:- start:6476 stop:7963 length:1488 start_codon:yes stop_codon:yes gene_type:complete
MALGSFKASLLGASASTGETYWAGLYYTQRSGSDFANKTFGAVDSEGDIVFGVSDNSNNPTFATISGGSSPSILADSGGYYTGMTQVDTNGSMVVRDDGKIAAAWAYNGTYRYTLHTSKSDWSIASGFTPYTTAGPYGNYSGGNLYTKTLVSKSNEDFGAWISYLAFNGTYYVLAAQLRDSGTSGNTTEKWDSSLTGNHEVVTGLTISSGDNVWVSCLEETGSSINKIQYLGWDKDTTSPGDAGTDKETLEASGYGFKQARYNAASGYDNAGYTAAGISWPNTAYGITVARSTSADAPETLDWVRKIQFGSPAYTYSDGIRDISDPVLDSAGNIYVAYWQRLLNPQKYCYVIVSWENDGTFRWARTLAMYGSSSYAYTSQQPCTLAITPNDSLLFFGTGGITTSSTDHPAALIARLPTDGSLTSSSAIQPRGDGTAEIYWMNDLTGDWAPSEAAGNLVAGTDTGEYMNSGTGTTSNMGTTTSTNTRTFAQAEVTG